jgi:hypothetical protein
MMFFAFLCAQNAETPSEFTQSLAFRQWDIINELHGVDKVTEYLNRYLLNA